MHLKDILISVIIPVYNVEAYLGQCLKSIVGQTYKNLEIIVIDDGSTDKSSQICDEYAKSDKRILVVHQNNAGMAEARNRGVQKSQGEYIFFVDSDDFIASWCIEHMYTILQETGSDLVCFELVHFFDGMEENVIREWGNKKEEVIRIYQSEEILEKSLYQNPSITAPYNKFCKRNLFTHISFPTGRYYEDFAVSHLFLTEAGKIAVTNLKPYAYRIRESGIMNQKFSNKKLDCVWVADKVYNDINTMFPNLKIAAACAAFRLNRLVFYQIPFYKKEEKKMVWNEIKRFRGEVVLNTKVQYYERLIALGSYGGQIIFCFVLRSFKSIRAWMIKHRIGRYAE